MKKLVFTNGCFDLIHPGHIQLLEQAKALGTYLIVGINSDNSVRSIKGPDRPLLGESERAEILRAMRAVDEVRIFDEQTPAKLIQEIRPDVLVKGGDWPVTEIVGASFVQSYGGEVRSLPLRDGFSSTRLIENMKKDDGWQASKRSGVVAASLAQHQEVFEHLAANFADQIEQTARLLLDTFMAGKKVLIFGNGGSAADAQHLAAEFVGRYETERKGLPAIALTTDTSALTALANDYQFDRVFARQVEALAAPGDCVIAISTSGNSPNVISAVMAARERECKVIGLTGEKGKKLAGLSDACIMVPSARTARIQEAHIAIAHLWCELIDGWIGEK